MTRGGKPVPRPRGAPLPCSTCPKIPPGTDPHPDNAVELGERELAAWEHYRECRAVGAFPDDPLVRRNAAIIRQVEDSAERQRELRTGLKVLGSILKGG